MTIEKLKSGSYRIGQMVDGKLYRITIDHKPTNKEAVMLMADKLADKVTVSADMPFNLACKAYISSRSNVLSPSSIRRYNQYLDSISEGLGNTRLSAVTKPMIQSEINSFTSGHSPKTISNYAGFLTAVLNYFGNNVGKLTLPQKEKKTPYIPTEDEVKAIFNEIKGGQFEVPIMLSAMGLRRSEVCALQITDLSPDNVLTINKAKVQNEKKEWVIKTTKTTDSTRTIIIPDYLADLIRKQGYVYNGFPNSIYNHLMRVQKKLGIQQFPLHKMRHFFASYMHNKGYSDSQVQEMGGWRTPNILRSVYTHSMEIEKAKAKAAADIGSLM